jgi:hypothetical protein
MWLRSAERGVAFPFKSLAVEVLKPREFLALLAAM